MPQRERDCHCGIEMRTRHGAHEIDDGDHRQAGRDSPAMAGLILPVSAPTTPAPAAAITNKKVPHVRKQPSPLAVRIRELCEDRAPARIPGPRPACLVGLATPFVLRWRRYGYSEALLEDDNSDDDSMARRGVAS